MGHSDNKYSLLMRFFHWITGVGILALLASGYYMVGLNPEVSPEKWEIYGLHKSFGVIMILLVTIRFLVRLNSKLPKPVESSPVFLTFIADLNHKLFYILMFIIPISGYLMSSMGGFGVAIFGYKMPEIFSVNKDYATYFYSIHTFIPYILCALIILHIAAVLKYLVIDRKNILKRMI